MKLPLGWKHAEIKDVAEVVTGSTPPTADPPNYDGDYLFITPGDITGGSIITSSARTVTKLGYNSGRPIPPYSTLVTCIGSSIGKTGISGEWSITNQQINAAVPLNANSYFLFYAISNQSEQMKRLAGSQALPILPKSSFQRIVIALPSADAEQERIGNLLLTWDTAIEKTERMIAVKGKRFSWLLSWLLSNSKHHRGHIRDFTIEVSKRNSGGAIERVLSVTNNRGFVLPEDQFELRVASNDLSNYKIITGGQYAYNPSRINVGSIARLDSWGKGVLSPMYVVFRLNENNINNDFFPSHEAKERIGKSAQGSVRETVSFGDFGAIPFPIPPLEQQQQIASNLNIARQEIDLLKRRAEAYHKQKRGLMQKLLTGQ